MKLRTWWMVFGLAAIGASAQVRVETTMGGDGAATERAIDGDAKTTYKAAKPAAAGDTFTVILPAAQKLTTIGVLTGQINGQGRVAAGELEVSADGTSFTKLADMQQGEVMWTGTATVVKAARLRITEASEPVTLREFVLEDAALACVVSIGIRSPLGKLSVKCNYAEVPKEQAVRLRAELDRVAEWYGANYPDIVRLIDAPTNDLPRDLTLRFRSDLKPGVPGYAQGAIMTLSVPHVFRHVDDVRGMFVHELTHVAQAYPVYEPSWLVEGIADAVRYSLSPADDAWKRGVDRLDPKKLDYAHKYGEAARFILWVQAQNHPNLVAKLSRALKDKRYNDQTWTELTGKQPKAWLEAFRAGG